MTRYVIPKVSTLEALTSSLQLIFDKMVQDINALERTAGERVQNVGQPAARGDAVNLGYLRDQLTKLQSTTAAQIQSFHIPKVFTGTIDVGGLGVVIFAGVGDPTGVIKPPGSLYLDLAGKLWVSIDGLGNWRDVSTMDLTGHTLVLDASSPNIHLKKSGVDKFVVTQDGNTTMGTLASDAVTISVGSGTKPLSVSVGGVELFNVDTLGVMHFTDAVESGGTVLIGGKLTLLLNGTGVGNKPLRTNALQEVAEGAIDLNSSDVTGILPIGSGGTGASDAGGALSALGAAPASGFSGGGRTVPLAKITPGGSDGSITLNDYGIATSAVDPT